MNLCAFLAPDIPRSLIVEHAEVLPVELAEAAGDVLRFNDTIKLLGRYSLVTDTTGQAANRRRTPSNQPTAADMQRQQTPRSEA